MAHVEIAQSLAKKLTTWPSNGVHSQRETVVRKERCLTEMVKNSATKFSQLRLINVMFGMRFFVPSAVNTRQRVKPCVTALIFFCLAGCASSPQVHELANFETQKQDQEFVSLNEQIAKGAAIAKQSPAAQVYSLGTGDLLELTVFRVPELNRKVRVNAGGQIMLPLLGTLDVGGLSVGQAESLIADKLAADYLQNPQVSLFVEEFRSQEITVMGAVDKPDVYSVKRARSIFEMLSLAGGLTRNAGDLIRVKTRQIDPESGQLETIDLLMSLNKLLAGDGPAANFMLAAGDSILVPEAGFVTVEGAVAKPGSYKMDGETNVIKAVALAGGIPWTGKQKSIRVIRNVADELVVIDVDLRKVRDQPNNDIVLQDGDVVSVSHSATRRAVAGFFKAAGQILGYRIN